MGIRGLNQFVSEHLDALENYKLKNCNVIIDGRNLAHFLHRECTGVNVAFGGDFDKYASFVRKFFKRLEACSIKSLVVMDGGQPKNNKKFRTAQVRAKNSIVRALYISPENQFRDKVFPPICMQVFVTTLRSMGILVLQSDYEADDEIAALARNLNCIVISEDTDFYVADVNCIQIFSLRYNKGLDNDYISCRIFNRHTFCEQTGISHSHLALFGSLLENDFFDHELHKFHRRVCNETRRSKKIDLADRVAVISCFCKWMSRRKQQSVHQIINEATEGNSELRDTVLMCLKSYTLPKSILMDSIPFIVHTNTITDETEDTVTRKEYVFDTKNLEAYHQSPRIKTTLKMKNGRAPPSWFIKSFRESRIPREIADILTQGYFFSPPQIELTSKVSSYLVVEPIVRLIYTFLWKGYGTGRQQKMSATDDDPSETFAQMSLNEKEGDIDSSKKSLKTFKDDAKFRQESAEIKSKSDEAGGEMLHWYIRKKKTLFCKHLSFLKKKLAKHLPSLSTVEDLSEQERMLAFYKIPDMKFESLGGNVPTDIELIMSFIRYWFKNTKESLYDCHAMAVLISFFLFYLIDNKIGHIRSWKGFEHVESTKAKLSEILKDSSYCDPDMSLSDLHANVSHEECLVAGSRLFKYHHVDKEMNNRKYRRDVVHAFSEYQACVYFLQLWNTLLCSPFPFLSIEFLWGGTFGYNVFIELNGSGDRISKISQLFGEGTCLARMFSLIFCKLDEELSFPKPPADKADKKNSKRFVANHKENFEDRFKVKVEDSKGMMKEVKAKSKTRSYDIGQNRFAELLSDSDSEDGEILVINDSEGEYDD